MKRAAQLIAAGLGAGTAIAPAAASVIQTYFNAAKGGPSCYARHFDAEHLRKHPRQRLLSMTLAGTRGEAGQREIELRYAFRLKTGPDIFAGLVVCAERGSGLSCEVEGDGGDFKVTPADGGLKLTVGERWEVEGERSVSPDLARGGDDRVVLLQPAPMSACIAALRP